MCSTKGFHPEEMAQCEGQGVGANPERLHALISGSSGIPLCTAVQCKAPSESLLALIYRQTETVWNCMCSQERTVRFVIHHFFSVSSKQQPDFETT